MEGSRDFGLVFSDEEVSSCDHQAEQPRVRWAVKVVHHAAKKLLAGGPGNVPLEVLLEGRDHDKMDKLAGGEPLGPRHLYAIAAVLAPEDTHLAAQMLAGVSRWLAAALLEGSDEVDLLALGRALARFLEAHDVSPREVLECYGRGVGAGEQAG